VLSTDESYVLFLASLAGDVDEIVLIGREAPEPGRGPYVLDERVFSLCPLPYYADLYRLWRADPRIYRRILRRVREEAGGWDAIMISGPHPIGQLIARACIARGVPVVPMVRQNLLEQMGAHRGLKRVAALCAARALEWDFRRIARGRTVFAVGAEMAREYGRVSPRVHNHFACLVDRAQFDMFSGMEVGADPTRLVCVCRLAPEKGHAYLLQALARLNAQGLACHLDVVGDGALKGELEAMAAGLGLGSQVTFHGYVAYGAPLFDLYRRAGALVLSSITEGFPQVINEALSMGLPIVATAVGGIPSFLADGETALLVPPRDPAALAGAIARLAGDGALRERLARQGRALMRENTLEANRTRVLEGLRDEIARHA
jgi:glycosyltransferase involved in cell wall biosynthesis